jgi:hypothetical protein
MQHGHAAAGGSADTHRRRRDPLPHLATHTHEGRACLGGVHFRALCRQILGEPAGGGSPWDLRVVPAQNLQYGVEHFVDADPTTWPCWLQYLRSGSPREVPFVEAGPLRDRVIRGTRRAGLAKLADGLGLLVDWGTAHSSLQKRMDACGLQL